MEEYVTEIYGCKPLPRSSSVLSNNGVPHRKWTLNTQELNSNIMDEERSKFRVYEYLCHVGETKEWMERLLKKELAPISGFETQLQYGVTLAELAKLFSPESVKKIFENEKLQFRHSDNINYFFEALKKIQFPEIFYFELTDCYEKKNMPKVIYCLHALSHVLEFKGYGKAVRDLVGKLEFTDKEVEAQYEALRENNINLPTFNNLENKLQEELQKSTVNINLEEIKKSNESILDDFVPGKNFYRRGSEMSINEKTRDTGSLQKQMFKNLNRNDRIGSTGSINSIVESKEEVEEDKELKLENRNRSISDELKVEEKEEKVEEEKAEQKEEEKVEEVKVEQKEEEKVEQKEEETKAEDEVQTETKDNIDMLELLFNDSMNLLMVIVLILSFIHSVNTGGGSKEN